MPAYRLAIFDFDGTLADSAGWVAGVFNDVARRYRFREIDAAEREALRSLPPREGLRALGIPAWKLPFIAAHMRRRVSREIDVISPFPWVGALLARLKAEGVVVAIVSSNSEANIIRVLGPEAAAVISHFGTGASMFGKAAKFRKLVRRSGFSPDQVISVGDEVRDIEAAREAGIASAAVTWGYATEDALIAAGPTAMVASAWELERLLLGGRGEGA
jgi:phosphoglycolate phosphatase